jgi:hypothetical protein
VREGSAALQRDDSRLDVSRGWQHIETEYRFYIFRTEGGCVAVRNIEGRINTEYRFHIHVLEGFLVTVHAIPSGSVVTGRDYSSASASLCSRRSSPARFAAPPQPQLAALALFEKQKRPSSQGATDRAVMLAALPFAHHSQLCCDCIAVQANAPHLVAVGSYELLSEASPSGSDAAAAGGSHAGVGGQVREGAVDFFQVEGDALRPVHRVPCAAGPSFPATASRTSFSHSASVFDMDWSNSADACLAVSTADGSLLLISGCIASAEVRTVSVAVESSCMASGVAWHADSLSLCCSLTRSFAQCSRAPLSPHPRVPVALSRSSTRSRLAPRPLSPPPRIRPRRGAAHGWTTTSSCPVQTTARSSCGTAAPPQPLCAQCGRMTRVLHSSAALPALPPPTANCLCLEATTGDIPRVSHPFLQ